MLTTSGTLKQRVVKNWACYVMILPFCLLFITFIVLPVISASVLSFTNFNMLELPKFAGFENYIRLFLDDDEFLIAVRNTLIFAIITGPISFIACLLFAWLINELGRKLRTILTIVFYLPAMSGMIFVIWSFIFSGDQYGLINSWLRTNNFIDEPIQWLTDPRTVLAVIIIVQLWMSLGTSFLAFIAGLQTVDRQLYEAASVDGVRNRFQELIYITLPSMGPQLLFAAVIQIGTAFAVSSICVTLAGFPGTDNAALTVVTHIQDYGNTRFEMGYACAISVVLFIFMMFVNESIQRLIKRYASV